MIGDMNVDNASIALRERAPPATAGLRARAAIRGRAVWRGATDEATWVRPALLGLLGGTAVLYLWNLAASGWANAYYSAAVQAGSQDWLAMLFGSFDASNAITVDKPPASLWVMALSARLFGFSAWSVLMPQALMGVASVWLLFLTVRRSFGAPAGLLAGAVLALTPIATLMFRFNNPDALLVLLLTAAAYGTVRALEHGSTRWLVLAGALVGFAFLAKMLQAFLVIPALGLVWMVAAPSPLPRRLWQLGAAALAVIVSAGWYVALVELWPAAARPYIGGSQTNSLLELMVGYNGLGRISGDEVGRIGGGGGGPFSDGAGIFRLFDAQLAGQIAWLLPTALVCLVAVLVARRTAARIDLQRAQALLWGGWLICTGLVFSLMEGIFHGYYTVALAPAIGALVGTGAATAWAHRADPRVRWLTAAGLAGTAAWAAWILSQSPAWNVWLTPVLIGAAGAAVLLVVVPDGRPGVMRTAAVTAAVAVLLLAPGVASVATAAHPHTGAIHTAEPAVAAGIGGNGPGRTGRFGANGPLGLPNRGAGTFQPPAGGISGPGGPRGNGAFPAPGALGRRPGSFGSPLASGAGQDGARRGGIGGLLHAGTADPALVAALQSDAAAYRWVAATTGSNNAAGLSLSSGDAVMSIGGFNGTDPSPTLAEFQAYVAAGAIHYYVAGRDAAGFAGAQGGADTAGAIADWVAATFGSQAIGGVTVYDLSGAN